MNKPDRMFHPLSQYHVSHTNYEAAGRSLQRLFIWRPQRFLQTVGKTLIPLKFTCSVQQHSYQIHVLLYLIPNK